MSGNLIEFKAKPTLRIMDYAKAMEFYIDFLEFSIDWKHRFGPKEPIYMQVSNRGMVLHLSENKRFQLGNIVFVETKGIEKFYNSLIEKNSSFLKSEVQKTDWGTLQLEIEDPFNNLLRFNETII